MASAIPAAIVYKGPRASIGAVELDASVTETHGGEVEVSEHPVEKGANVTDHARAKPATLTIEGLISNTPIAPNADTRAAALGQVSAGRDVPRGTPGRAGAAFETLVQLKDAGALLKVVTRLKTYDGMIITSLSVPRDARTGDALRFTVALKQVRIVETQRTEVKASAVASGKQVQEPKRAPEVPPESKQERQKSLLKQADDARRAAQRAITGLAGG